MSEKESGEKAKVSITRKQFIQAGMASVLTLAISACKSTNQVEQAPQNQSSTQSQKTTKISARCNLKSIGSSVRNLPPIIVLTGCCAKSEGHSYYIVFGDKKSNYSTTKDIEVVSGRYKLTTIVGSTKDGQCILFDGFDFDYSENCHVVFSEETKDEYLERKSKETGKPKGLIASDIQDTQWLDNGINLVAKLSKCEDDYTAAYKQFISNLNSGKISTEQVFGISVDELKSLQL